MRLGGNSRARQALESVLEERDLKTRYESSAAEAYRLTLKTEVYAQLGLPLEEPPAKQQTQATWSASNDPRFRNATAISSDQFYRPRGQQPPRNEGPCPCSCTIL